MIRNINSLTFTALMTAILCILGPIVLPVGVIPVSFVNMAIYLAIILLEKKKATVSVVLYLLIGFVGIPVFAGFTAGAGKLFGPTGGYLIGYPVMSWISGCILETGSRMIGKCKRISGKMAWMINHVLALMLGTMALYLFGSIWLMYQSNISLTAAVITGVVPFIVLDMIKIMIACAAGYSIKKRISFFIS